MSFTSEIAKPFSERFILAQVQPKLLLTGAVSIGGNQYTFSLSNDFIVDEFQVNGVAKTIVSHTGDVLTISSLVDLTVATNISVAILNIFMSTTKGYVTDGTGAMPAADWLPIITGSPDFRQSMANITEGYFQLSGTSLSIISTDRWVQRLCDADASWYKAKCNIWMCINSVDNARLVFVGEVVSLNYAYGRCSLELIDNFNKLKQSAEFGVTTTNYSESKLVEGNTAHSSDWSYPSPSNLGKIVPITFGKTTPFKVEAGWRHLDPFGDPPSETWHLSEGQRCYKTLPDDANTNYTDTVTFACGRFFGTYLKKLNFGTISAAYRYNLSREILADKDTTGAYLPVTIYDYIIYLQCSAYNCEIGDYVPELDGFVCGYGSGLYGSYNVAVGVSIFGEDYAEIGGPSVATGSIAVPTIANNTNPSMSMWIDAGSDVRYDHMFIGALATPPQYGIRHHGRRYLKFTTTVRNYTYKGQQLGVVTAFVDPVANKLTDKNSSNKLLSNAVKCRFSPYTEMDHTSMVAYCLDAAGVDRDSASFTATQSDVPAFIALTTPSREGTDFETYLELAQNVARSAFCTLNINSDGEAEYKPIKNPDNETAVGARSPLNLIQDATSMAMDYQDVYSTVELINPQIKGVAELNGTGSYALVDDDTTKYLHGIETKKTVEHCLTDISVTQDSIVGYYNNPRATYVFETSSDDLNTNVADVLELTNECVARSAETANVAVLSVTTNAASTQIKTSEIRGLP